MSVVPRQVLAHEYQQAVICYYQYQARELLLRRLVMFGSSMKFEAMAEAMADDLGTTPVAAAKLLWPITHRIYEAAREAA